MGAGMSGLVIAFVGVFGGRVDHGTVGGVLGLGGSGFPRGSGHHSLTASGCLCGEKNQTTEGRLVCVFVVARNRGWRIDAK